MTLFRREWLLALRNLANFVNPIAFFIIVISLFPMTTTVGFDTLAQFAPDIIWVAILLAIMISLPSLFQSDYEDGSLEQWFLSTQSCVTRVLMRVVVHWLFLIAPIIVLTPVAALFLNMATEQMLRLMLSLLLATPTIVFVGAIVSALLLTSRQASILLAVLVLPLVIPVLIFSVALVNGYAVGGVIAILVGLLALSVSLAPLAVVGALQIS